MLYVPNDYQPGRRTPFSLMLHGAGGTARGGLGPFLNQDPGVILLSTKSRERSWDLMALGGFGPDLRFIDRALRYVFERYAVDPDRIGVLGFSDGASYALSIGLTNGDLFTHLMALSPGYMQPGELRGKPAVFIGHGVNDTTLPIESTSEQIVARLENEGYDVTFVRHEEGHTPRPVGDDALAWFLDD